MANEWMWRCQSNDGATMPNPLGDQRFPNQGDAESWIGETWRDLLAEGVESVTLLEGEREVYGPMGLRAG